MDDLLLTELLGDLNPQQQRAASAGFEPLLIVAGAGTGKTTTLAHRVAYQLATGVDPSRILLLTFTRRAAAEMSRRVESILRRIEETEGDRRSRPSTRMQSRRIWGGTFHAIATRLLRKHGRTIGVPQDFTIMDQGDSQDLMQVIRTDLDLATGDKRFPQKSSCLAIYSRCINTSRPLREILGEDYPWAADHETELRALFDGYMDRKEQNGVLDYDDLLLFWRAMLEQSDLGELLSGQFDCVLVDEYQDTNLLQADILRRMRPSGIGLTVVGDDAQSIYAFRGATVRNILDFPEEYPNATVVKLEQNYRSTPSILDVTNRVIEEAREGHRKTLWSSRDDLTPPVLVECQDEDEETEYLLETILERNEAGTPLRDQAVLFRASHHCMILEAELTRRGIPFQKYGGLKFMETAHVKDLLAFLRLIENPRDVVSGQRVLTLLPGIGQKTARKLMIRLLEDAESGNPFAAWREVSPPTRSREIWPSLVALLSDLVEMPVERRSVTEEVRQVFLFYKPLLEQKYDSSGPRLRDLEQLEQVAARFPDRSTFLTEITLDPPSSTRDLSAEQKSEEDFLVLSTIHSAKGLEWDSVTLLQACDGSIPSQRSLGSEEDLEEERRLFYVALTRAKTHLQVMHPCRIYTQNRFRGDAYGYAPISRFLPRETRKLFEVIFPGEMMDPETGDETEQPEISERLTTADIREQLRQRM